MIESLPLLMWPDAPPRLTILIYHRVLPQPDPLRIGEVDAKTFTRQMDMLARHFTVMPLMDAVEALQQSRLPKRACCITFDDGYSDNLTVAQPILQRFGLPATVFVATGYLDGGRMFNDTVIEFVARVAGPLLDLQSLNLGAHRIVSPEDRRSAIKSILDILRYLPPDERDEVVKNMLQAVPCGPLPTDLMLTTEQVKALSDRGIEIGGHTVAHTVLTTLDVEAARAEISEGKKQLEAMTGKRVRTFAYPNGRPGRDYSSEHVALVKALQFDAAVTTAHGVSAGQDDIYQLPRFTPWGRSTTLLAARMTRNAIAGKPASVCASTSTASLIISRASI
jgi:peptidoglycan/xylan/chitin deacetylase (PgdA/CDA1 family)